MQFEAFSEKAGPQTKQFTYPGNKYKNIYKVKAQEWDRVPTRVPESINRENISIYSSSKNIWSLLAVEYTQRVLLNRKFSLSRRELVPVCFWLKKHSIYRRSSLQRKLMEDIQSIWDVLWISSITDFQQTFSSWKNLEGIPLKLSSVHGISFLKKGSEWSSFNRSFKEGAL